MGVPAFYRWLSEKFPKIVVDMLEKRNTVVEGVEIPVDLLEANPNEIEFDNLYVDMNGLIHPCSHPEDREAPTTEAEMYVNVMKYVDRLFAAVRPRRLVFLAIDGVAPRAKMNQQRARRFRAANDAKERNTMMQEVLHEMEELGLSSQPGKGGPEWDSNVITPGTEFMYNLSLFLRYYILDRMNRNPAWRSIKVLLSDASEPGEGEHKIMQFIRSQRCHPDYDPNQHHVLHGLDADLIMLALATHEPHFTILREQVTFGRRERDKPDKSQARQMLEAQAAKDGSAVSAVNPMDEWIFAKPLQALHIGVLREYLENEFSCLAGHVPFGYDFERIIDDFVFLCFFVGNDFLPHLPSLDIRDGAIDYLLQLYKELLPSLGDYVTSPGGNVNLEPADIILARVGEIEDMVFQSRKTAEDEEARRRQYRTQGQGQGNSRHQQFARPQAPPPQLFTPAQLSMQSSSRPYPQQENNPGGQHAFRGNHTQSHPTRDAVVGNLKPADVGADAGAANHNAAARMREMIAKRPRSDNAAPSRCDDGVSKMSDPSVEGSSSPAEHKFARTAGDDTGSGPPSMIEGDGGVILSGDAEGCADGEQKGEELVAQLVVGDEELLAVDEVEVDDDDELVDLDGPGPAFPLSVPLVKVVAPPLEVADEASAEALAEDFLLKVQEDIKKRIKEKESAKLDRYRETTVDNVRLHEQGWKSRYYEDPPKRDDLVQGGGLARMCATYVEGLCWVLKYYYEGCPSWNWYYPFHYAPFASDLINIDRYNIRFELAEPFRPVEQLLAVLPSESVTALPTPCRWLMTEENSPISDLYSSDAPLDPNGKHLPWLWVLLLPFVDERRIQEAFLLCRDKLSLEERRRNAFGHTLMFVSREHELARALSTKGFKYKPGPERDAHVLAALKVSADVAAEAAGEGEGEGEGADVDVEDTAPGKDGGPDDVKGAMMTPEDGGVVSVINAETDAAAALDAILRAPVPDLDTGDEATRLKVDQLWSALTGGAASASNGMGPQGGDVAKWDPAWATTGDYAVPGGMYFDGEMGGGICGVLAPPPPQWFAPLDSPVSAPPASRLVSSVRTNQVMCLTFLFPPQRAYDSRLLPRCVLKPRVLSGYDLVPKRPPRLGKARFNLVDLVARSQQGFGNGNGPPQHHLNHPNYPNQHQERIPGYAYEMGLAASQRMITSSLGGGGYMHGGGGRAEADLGWWGPGGPGGLRGPPPSPFTPMMGRGPTSHAPQYPPSSGGFAPHGSQGGYGGQVGYGGQGSQGGYGQGGYGGPGGYGGAVGGNHSPAPNRHGYQGQGQGLSRSDGAVPGGFRHVAPQVQQAYPYSSQGQSVPQHGHYPPYNPGGGWAPPPIASGRSGSGYALAPPHPPPGSSGHGAIAGGPTADSMQSMRAQLARTIGQYQAPAAAPYSMQHQQVPRAAGWEGDTRSGRGPGPGRFESRPGGPSGGGRGGGGGRYGRN